MILPKTEHPGARAKRLEWRKSNNREWGEHTAGLADDQGYVFIEGSPSFRPQCWRVIFRFSNGFGGQLWAGSLEDAKQEAQRRLDAFVRSIVEP
jgi:hypothetical protein